MGTLLKAFGTWFINTVLGKFLVVTLIGGMVKLAVGFGIGYAISVLAVGTIAYQGVSYTLDWTVQNMQSILLQLPPDQLEILSMVATRLRFDEILTIIFTAYATVMALWTFKGAWTIFTNSQS